MVKINNLFNFRLKMNSSQPARYQKINRSWLAVETIVLAAVIILFNILAFDIGLFGFVTSAADPGSFVPLRSPAFKAVLPWLNLWWGMALLINLINLKLGRWFPLTRMVDVGLGLLGVGVLITVLILGPGLILDPAWTAQQIASGVDLESLEGSLLPIINSSLIIAISIALISLIAASLRKIFYLAKSWRLQGQDVDILLKLGLVLAALFVISAPSAAVRANANLLDLSVPLGIITVLIFFKIDKPPTSLRNSVK